MLHRTLCRKEMFYRNQMIYLIAKKVGINTAWHQLEHYSIMEVQYYMALCSESRMLNKERDKKIGSELLNTMTWYCEYLHKQ